MRPPARIGSASHPAVKLARALASPRARRKLGLAWLEGARAVGAALAGRTEAKALLLADGGSRPGDRRLLALAAERGVPAYVLPARLFGLISRVESPQGVGLVCAPPGVTLDEALAGSLVLVVDGVREPGNLGSLLRCAGGLGADAVVTTRGTVDAANPKSARAAAGAWPGLPMAEGVDAGRLREGLDARGFAVVIAQPHGGEDYRRADWRGRVALVLGSEARGAGPELSARSRAVRVPLSAGVESLNVTAAAALLLAEARRSREVGRGR